MTKLTGLAYLLEHASFADKEAREKTEARIKPLLDAIDAHRHASSMEEDEEAADEMYFVVDAIDGDQAARVSLGMEKGE